MLLRISDSRTPEFAEEARQQSRAIANSPHEVEDQAFIDSVSEIWSQVNDVKAGPATASGADPSGTSDPLMVPIINDQ